MREKEGVLCQHFQADSLGGKVISPQDPCVVRLADSWNILNAGGAPTPDKPEVVLEPSADPNRIHSLLTPPQPRHPPPGARLRRGSGVWRHRGELGSRRLLEPPVPAAGGGYQGLTQRKRKPEISLQTLLGTR